MSNSALNKAYELLEKLSKDPETIAKYEEREKQIREYDIREEGRIEAITHVAKKMRSEGFSPDIVMKITGLSTEELEKLS
ncbi:hypothetical protein [Silvanigrella sp.]|jgi:predicted transposase/invertase (TIGR01784 family)|uniref:hypothetical protein n=1 Tax=Silvanigrella sp. TaxID=2024976 RepID=UPI0037CA2BFD